MSALSPASYVTFLTPLQVDVLSRNEYVLTQPMGYDVVLLDGSVLHFEVPAGFHTDFASVPRLPIMFWLFGGRGPKSAVLHDYLIRVGYDFHWANTVFSASLVNEEPAAARWAMRFGVDVGAAFSSHGPRPSVPGEFQG